MTERLVVDASVAVKWFVAESGSNAARGLLDLQEQGRFILLAPPLLLSEVCSALACRVRRGLMTLADAEQGGGLIEEFVDIQEEPAAVRRGAIRLAGETDQHYYGCLYLILALEQECGLITADERFHKTMAHAYPRIRLLQE